MKKILLSSILFLSIWAVNAQRTSIGITTGFGTAWMSDTHQDVIFNPAWNLGGTLVHSTERHWGFGIDVKYSREGVRYQYPGFGVYNGQTMTTQIVNNYIRVSLRAIYFFKSADKSIRPNISVGPSFGFLTGGSVHMYDGSDREFSKTPTKDYINAFDIGLQGTLGASFTVAEGIWLSADLAYYQGLMQQNKNGSSNMMNRNLGINLGLRFGIGK